MVWVIDPAIDQDIDLCFDAEVARFFTLGPGHAQLVVRASALGPHGSVLSSKDSIYWALCIRASWVVCAVTQALAPSSRDCMIGRWVSRSCQIVSQHSHGMTIQLSCKYFACKHSYLLAHNQDHLRL